MKILAFGEVMMRLTPPLYAMLEQSTQLDVAFVGTGVNLLGGLARFGHEVALVSKVPDNAIGKAAKARLRQLGINDQWVEFAGDHMGSFLVELGYGNRPSVVTYQNRLASSFCVSGKEAYDLEAMLAGVTVVHICGITLSLTPAVREMALTLAKQAKSQGVTVCFDFNYRPSLNVNNDPGVLRQTYETILELADVVFGNMRDIIELLGVKVQELAGAGKWLHEHYGVSYFAGTQRKPKELKGFVVKGGVLYESSPVTVEILDRIGSGDAFALGVLHGYLKGWEMKKLLDFAVANAQLAHTTLGDVPMLTEGQVLGYLANPQVDLLR